MATKTIKAWIDGAVREIEVEDIVSPEQPLSVEERVDILEDKHEVVFTDGNLLVGNGTEELEEMTPEEVLEHINGASIATMTTDEYNALEESDSINANTLYMLSDAEEEEVNSDAVLYTEQSLDEEQKAQARMNIGVGESIADTLMHLDIISGIVEDDGGSLAESDGTILVTRNDDIFLPEITEENNGDVLKVVDGKWKVDTIDIPEVNYPVTSVNGQTGDVKIDIPEQVQSNWNQNDSTKPDYVKNKPFGIFPKVLIEETVVTPGNTPTFIPTTDSFVENFEYKVTVDGVEYTCICVNVDGLVFIGNPAFLGGEPSQANEPFFVGYDSSGAFAVFSGRECTIRVDGNVVVPLPLKYAPQRIEVNDIENDSNILPTCIYIDTNYFGIENYDDGSMFVYIKNVYKSDSYSGKLNEIQIDLPSTVGESVEFTVGEDFASNVSNVMHLRTGETRVRVVDNAFVNWYFALKENTRDNGPRHFEGLSYRDGSLYVLEYISGETSAIIRKLV